MATEPPSLLEVSHLGDKTKTVYSSYSSRFDEIYANQDDERVKDAPHISQDYYNLVTDFYEYGYGLSFHFGPVYGDQGLQECISEFEIAIGRDLHAKSGTKLLDIGCGVGGPALQIAKATGTQVVGLNLNEYQIERARIHTKKAGLEHLCSFDVGDFSNMKQYADNTFDGGYGLETVCHAVDPIFVYKELLRVLKPGACFIQSEWVLTEKYIPGNPAHEKIKHEIVLGGGVPTIRTAEFFLSRAKEAGFEIVLAEDFRLKGDLPWYIFLEGKGCCSLQGFRASAVGRTCTHVSLTGLELIGMVPKGTTKVHKVLVTCADSLIASGKVDVFSPMYRIVARKPLS